MTGTNRSPKTDDPSGVTSLQRLNARLKRLVEERTKGEQVRVRGMAWDVRRTQSAHVRFRLRHGKYSLPCIVFRGLAQRLPFRIEDGQQLVIEGRIGIYEVWGELQLVARAVELDRGAEERETLSSLKARAQDEGWLAQDRKRALPRQPKMIGLIAGGDSRARADLYSTRPIAQ
jgi:exodeoxyribonuclease VII large subunit